MNEGGTDPPFFVDIDKCNKKWLYLYRIFYIRQQKGVAHGDETQR